MLDKYKLFKFKLDKKNDIIEIGGGEGDLCKSLIKFGYKVVLFVEPDINKYKKATRKLRNVECVNKNIENIDCKKINSKSLNVTVIMQDVIEHIKIDSQKIFFEQLKSNYKQIYLIGRTPNLKSPFGLRNSYGDNSHIYRFTDNSLKDFLDNLGFRKIKVSNEPYKITGFTSFLRYLPFLICIFICSIAFLFVYGQWEGFLTPNIVFYSEKV